jgi:hypothetical protein
MLVQAVVQRGILFDGTYRSIPTLQVRAIVVPNGVCVEHFPRVKGIVSGALQPQRQVVLIMAILDKDRKATYPELIL